MSGMTKREQFQDASRTRTSIRLFDLVPQASALNDFLASKDPLVDLV